MGISLVDLWFRRKTSDWCANMSISFCRPVCLFSKICASSTLSWDPWLQSWYLIASPSQKVNIFICEAYFKTYCISWILMPQDIQDVDSRLCGNVSPPLWAVAGWLHENVLHMCISERDWNPDEVHTFFLDSVTDIHSFWRCLSVGLSFLVINNPISEPVLVVPAKFFICKCTGFGASLQVIPPLEKQRDCDMILGTLNSIGEAKHTNLDQLLPIWMIKVGIQDFLLMHQGHPLKALGDVA